MGPLTHGVVVNQLITSHIAAAETAICQLGSLSSTYYGGCQPQKLALFRWSCAVDDLFHGVEQNREEPT